MTSFEDLTGTFVLVLFEQVVCVSFDTSIIVLFGWLPHQYERSVDVHWTSVGKWVLNDTLKYLWYLILANRTKLLS